MKKIILSLMLGFSLALTGCFVTSVYPFYVEKDLVFEPALLGDWREADPKENPPETVTFEKAGPDKYRVHTHKSDDKDEFEVHLFKLKNQLFMDSVLVRDKEQETIPAHQLTRVLQIQPTLRVSGLSHSWLKELLEKNPPAIRHHKIRKDPKDADYRIVLTAETKELQAFIMAHLEAEGAFDKPTEMNRK